VIVGVSLLRAQSPAFVLVAEIAETCASSSACTLARGLQHIEAGISDWNSICCIFVPYLTGILHNFDFYLCLRNSCSILPRNHESQRANNKSQKARKPRSPEDKSQKSNEAKKHKSQETMALFAIFQRWARRGSSRRFPAISVRWS